MIKSTIEVEITNINVGPKYFSFLYRVVQDSKLIKTDEYESDHVWQGEEKDLKEHLETGYAVKLALQQVY